MIKSSILTKQVYKILIILQILTLFYSFYDSLYSQTNIRKLAVAGMFYPLESDKLNKLVEDLLNNAKPIKTASNKSKIVGLIAPHAGYIYSGQTAAIAFKAIENQKFDMVFFLGVDHHIGLPEISIWKEGGYETPLGTVYIDASTTNELIQKFPELSTNIIQHLKEHSLEVLLPFYTKTLGNNPACFIVVGHNIQKAIKLGEVLFEIIANSDKRALVIASSDWSHYYTAEKAYNMDKIGIQHVLNLDVENLIKDVEQGKTELCGLYGVISLMTLMKKAQANATLLERTDSSIASGDKTRVVGYAAILLESSLDSNLKLNSIDKTNSSNISNNNNNKEKLQGGSNNMNNKNSDKKNYENNQQSYNKDFQIEALKAVRMILESYLKNQTIPNITFLDPKFNEERGVFVTLKKYKELRGCIGTIVPTQPLKEGIKEMAIAAATRDPRFDPVTYDELKDIEIEISVLSPLIPVNDLNEIVVGRDGLVLKKGFYSGVLLPQVPVEYGWDRETYLRHLCLKAGLPPGAHLSADAKLFRFTAEVFSEHELKIGSK